MKPRLASALFLKSKSPKKDRPRHGLPKPADRIRSRYLEFKTKSAVHFIHHHFLTVMQSPAAGPGEVA